MGNLWDGIAKEIKSGNLTEPFSPEDLRKLLEKNGGTIGGREYDPIHVGTILANHSVGPGTRKGNSVREGATPLFERFGRGQYRLLQDDNFDAEEPDLVDTPSESPSSRECFGDPLKQQAATKFVEFLREMPFRIKVKGARTDNWHPTGGPAIGWQKRLDSYHWKGANWTKTAATLSSLESRLSTLESGCALPTCSAVVAEADAKKIYEDIRDWGNPRGAALSGHNVLKHLHALWAGLRVTDVNSTLTKLYALSRPNDFAIYDSRVATAIMSIAECMYPRRTINGRVVDTVNEVHRLFPHLGHIGGTGGTRPRPYRFEWPNAYAVVGAQYEANCFCRLIVEKLNTCKEDRRSNWTLREVEAVLFMEGY